jgi:hypothetical protein
VVWLFGIGFVVLGVVMLVKRDWMWALTQMGNEFRGQASERSDLWEVGNAIGGVITIILGIVLILLPPST